MVLIGRPVAIGPGYSGYSTESGEDDLGKSDTRRRREETIIIPELPRQKPSPGPGGPVHIFGKGNL
jgi:hypothetical protein